jgi:hypothetical protein
MIRVVCVDLGQLEVGDAQGLLDLFLACCHVESLTKCFGALTLLVLGDHIAFDIAF